VRLRVRFTETRSAQLTPSGWGLIHSDGCRFQNTGRNWSWPRYSFMQVSDDIRRIFCEACDLIGVRWTASGKHTVYVSRKADVARLDDFIGPKA